MVPRVSIGSGLYSTTDGGRAVVLLTRWLRRGDSPSAGAGTVSLPWAPTARPAETAAERIVDDLLDRLPNSMGCLAGATLIADAAFRCALCDILS
jgi:hypothetical protein